LLLEFSITGIKSLSFDSQTVNYIIGDVVRGLTSTASARIIGISDTGTAGTLSVCDVIGTYQNNEILLGDNGGSALVNGAIASANQTLRYALAKENVTWGGFTWTATSIEIGNIEKSTDGSWSDMSMQIFNDIALNKLVEDCFGLEGESVTIRLVYSGGLSEAAVFSEVFTIASGSAVGAGWIQFSLGIEKPLSQAFPNLRYESSICRHQFKNALTCQYAGAITTCDHKLTTCAGFANEQHIGMFPGIPGGKVG
jgi:phage-related protein